MNPFDAFSYYMAVKLHFESKSYDCIKYGFKTKVSHDSFLKRRDKYFFAKLAKKYPKPVDCVQFLVSNFIVGRKWIGDMLEHEGEFSTWQKRIESLTYTFERDMDTLYNEVDSFENLFDIRDGSMYPYVLQKYMEGDIHLETIVILNDLVGFMKMVRNDPLVGGDLLKLVDKYKAFLAYDKKRMREAALRVFSS